MIAQKPSKTNPKKSQPRIEIRCIDCECSDGDKNGKLLGAILGVNSAMLEFLRAAGVKLELPCQNQKSKRRLVPL
jgi:hypothetical protein